MQAGPVRWIRGDHRCQRGCYPHFHQTSIAIRSVTARSGPAQRQQTDGAGPALPLSASAPVTDANVPSGHQSLHNSLYGAGEEHVVAGGYYRVRREEDDGTMLLPLQPWLDSRDGEKPLGVFGIYDEGQTLQYVGYSRNMVTTIRGLATRVGAARAAWVRAMVFANHAMATREQLEREVASWVDRFGGGVPPPGNSSEREAWDGAQQVKALSEAEAAEYAAKAAKMRLAMGETKSALMEDARTPESVRLNLQKAMSAGDWSEVVDRQTQEAVGAPPPPPSSAPPAPTAQTPAAAPVAARNGTPPTPIVSPFTKAEVHRTIGSSSGGGSGGGGGGLPWAVAAPREMTVASVDAVLEEVRPYLMADGGDVEVVDVTAGRVFLRLQGSCATCASSASTMKMGIERALQAAFGDQLQDVVQVDKIDVVSATADSIDMHLGMLRGAIHSFGGKVEVAEVGGGRCVLRYKGPPAIGKGVSAAIKDRFPEIRAVELLAFSE